MACENYMKVKFQCLLMNKVLLEHKHTVQFHVIYGCFPTIIAELCSYDRDLLAHKAQNIYYLGLHRKSLQNFALGYIPKLEVLKQRVCTFLITLVFQDGPANIPIYIPIASA